MNHWLKKRKKRRRYDITITMGKQKAKLIDTHVHLRESLNSIDISLNVDEQDDENIVEFYSILGDVFIDLSSFSKPHEARIVIVPNDETQDGYVIEGAVALTTNFDQIGSSFEAIKVEISFSYRTKNPLAKLSWP